MLPLHRLHRSAECILYSRRGRVWRDATLNGHLSYLHSVPKRMRPFHNHDSCHPCDRLWSSNFVKTQNYFAGSPCSKVKPVCRNSNARLLLLERLHHSGCRDARMSRTVGGYRCSFTSESNHADGKVCFPSLRSQSARTSSRPTCRGIISKGMGRTL